MQTHNLDAGKEINRARRLRRKESLNTSSTEKPDRHGEMNGNNKIDETTTETEIQGDKLKTGNNRKAD